MAVFALGGFVCIISILRLPFLYAGIHTDDVSYHNPMAAILSNIECNIGILCSCIPTLRCLFPKMFNNASSSSYMFSSSQSSSGLHSRKAHYAFGTDSFGTRRGPISSHATGPGISSSRKGNGHFRGLSGRDPALLDGADSIDQIELESRLDPGSEAIHVRTEIDQTSVGLEVLSDRESWGDLGRERSLSHF